MSVVEMNLSAREIRERAPGGGEPGQDVANPPPAEVQIPCVRQPPAHQPPAPIQQQPAQQQPAPLPQQAKAALPVPSRQLIRNPSEPKDASTILLEIAEETQKACLKGKLVGSLVS